MATPRPIKNAIHILKTDHSKVRNLLSTIKKTTDAKAKRENMNLVIKELCQHSEVEEQLVYPTLKTLNHNNKGAAFADRSVKEHLALKNILYKLDTMAATDPQFGKSCEELEKELEHHLKEEEEEVFPFMQANLSNDDLDAMGDLLEKLKVVAPTHPHPSAPVNPVAKGLTAPIAAFIDRIRDLGRTFPNQSK